jgi:hypothetical protein
VSPGSQLHQFLYRSLHWLRLCQDIEDCGSATTLLVQYVVERSSEPVFTRIVHRLHPRPLASIFICPTASEQDPTEQVPRKRAQASARLKRLRLDNTQLLDEYSIQHRCKVRYVQYISPQAREPCREQAGQSPRRPRHFPTPRHPPDTRLRYT